MLIKFLVDEDFVNYKKPSMFIGTPFCSMKCDKECGKNICQNSSLHSQENFEYDDAAIIRRYIDNPITESLVLGGFEPFDSWNEVFDFIVRFRMTSKDDIVIYTGYNEKEIETYLKDLRKIPNIIIKFGRFIPDQESHIDKVLGVKLASPNQYGVKIS